MATATVTFVRTTRARTLQRYLRTFDLSADAILAMPVVEARRRARAFSGRVSPTLLTPPDGNPKLWKSAEYAGRPTWGLTLLPSDASGAWNTCPWATEGCRASCLATSGRGRFDAIHDGRAWRTGFLAADPVAFLRLLFHEVTLAGRKAKRDKVNGAIRFNVLSDIDWTLVCPDLLRHAIAEGLAPYDYTKDATRTERARELGYDVSYSVSERDTDERVLSLLRSGRINRAVIVFAIRNRSRVDLPSRWNGIPVVDADQHDYRPADGTGIVSGLRAKDVASASFADGIASGFFRDVPVA